MIRREKTLFFSTTKICVLNDYQINMGYIVELRQLKRIKIYQDMKY